MLNLIRMNLFRLVHTKSIIIVFCLLMGLSVLSGSMSVYDKKEMQEVLNGQNNDNPQVQEEEADNPIGIYIDAPSNNDEDMKDYIYMYCDELCGGALLIFIFIGAVLFFRDDAKNGFLKNIAGQTKHRYNIFFSKLVVIAIYTFVCMACYMAIGFVAYKISWIIGVNVNLGMDYIPDVFNISFGVKHIPEVLGIFALEYLLYMAFTSGLLLITEITKSTAAAITMGMCGMMGFGVLFAVLVRKVFNTDFDISKYYISTSISNVYPGADRDIVMLALMAGIIFFIIYNVLNVVWFSRKDIV
ncbi:MAG: hypothetical protein OSJ45_05545 [Lachnospiraceae bacterium]|nr:hypothetical protein [Lachnospiraceae bacterium]